jgi:hypothetical protein
MVGLFLLVLSERLLSVRDDDCLCRKASVWSAGRALPGGSGRGILSGPGASGCGVRLSRGEAVGDRGRFAPVWRVEFAQDVRDVHAGGLDADDERGGDLAVGEAAGDERQHLRLARRQADFATHDVMGRVAHRLVELAERFGTEGDGGIEIELPLSQEELAGWTGASREAVSKALQLLRSLRVVETGRRHVTVLDLEALRRHAR